MSYNESDVVNKICTRMEGVEFGCDVPGFAVEFADLEDGCAEHVIQFIEETRFHLGYLGEDRVGIFDDAGELTDEAEKRALTVLKTLFFTRYQTLVGLGLSFEPGIVWDTPSFALELAIPIDLTTGMKLGEFVEGYFMPFYAAMVNVTDPGTFNHPYLFSEIRNELEG